MVPARLKIMAISVAMIVGVAAKIQFTKFTHKQYYRHIKCLLFQSDRQ